MIYVVKIPAKLFATLRTSIGKPQKMSGRWQWQWQVASGKWQPPSCRAPAFHCLHYSLLLSHTPSCAAFLMRLGQTHCCLLARTQASAGLDVFLNKCCG